MVQVARCLLCPELVEGPWAMSLPAPSLSRGSNGASRGVEEVERLVEKSNWIDILRYVPYFISIF